MTIRLLASVAGFLLLSACAQPSSASRTASASSAPGRRCVTAETSFYDNGMQQGRPADGRFPAGTVLRLDEPEGPVVQNVAVTDESGHHTFVDGSALAPLPNAACAKGNSP